METVRVKQEEETDTRFIYKVERVHEGEYSKQSLISAKDLIIELPEGRESPYHRLDLHK